MLLVVPTPVKGVPPQDNLKLDRIGAMLSPTDIKTKIKRLPDTILTKVERDSPDTEDEVNLSDDPAFDPSVLLDNPSPGKSKEAGSGVGGTLKKAASNVLHPRRAARLKATKITANKVSKSQRPYLSAEQDLELLRAHEDLAKAASSTSSAHLETADNGEAEVAARRRLQNIEENRASLKTAWALGRHAVRVRVVQKPQERPRRRDFIVHEGTARERWEWEKWLGMSLLWYSRDFTARYVDHFDKVPFDVQDLARIVERLAMVSAPWQTFLVDVRYVYTWQDKWRTARWAMLFWTLWYTEHIVGFVYAYVIYMTIRNKFYPSTVDTVRESMQRNLDREAQARAWGELIEKHGRSDWVEPLLADLGPVIQMQLGDLADFIETLLNFYRWERPGKTWASLFFFLSCLAITLLADMRYCMKIVWFIVGGSFFVTFPIAARYPKYRTIVDFLRWVFWDIPTHAELGIIELQEKAILASAEDGFLDFSLDSGNETPLSESESDYSTAKEEPSRQKQTNQLSFPAYQGKVRGRLFVSRTGLSFRDRVDVTDIEYNRLIEMRKVWVKSTTNRLRTFQSASKGLEFDFRDGLSETVRTLSLLVRRNDRHKIFSHVLAWSNVKWQSLQLDRHDEEENRKQVERSLDTALG